MSPAHQGRSANRNLSPLSLSLPLSLFLSLSLSFSPPPLSLFLSPSLSFSPPLSLSLSLFLPSQTAALRWCGALRVKSAACRISAEVTDASYPTQHHRGTGDTRHTNEPPSDTHTHTHTHTHTGINMHMRAHRDHKCTQTHTPHYMHMLRCIHYVPAGVYKRCHIYDNHLHAPHFNISLLCTTGAKTNRCAWLPFQRESGRCDPLSRHMTSCRGPLHTAIQ